MSHSPDKQHAVTHRHIENKVQTGIFCIFSTARKFSIPAALWVLGSWSPTPPPAEMNLFCFGNFFSRGEVAARGRGLAGCFLKVGPYEVPLKMAHVMMCVNVGGCPESGAVTCCGLSGVPQIHAHWDPQIGALFVTMFFADGIKYRI